MVVGVGESSCRMGIPVTGPALSWIGATPGIILDFVLVQFTAVEFHLCCIDLVLAQLAHGVLHFHSFPPGTQSDAGTGGGHRAGHRERGSAAVAQGVGVHWKHLDCFSGQALLFKTVMLGFCNCRRRDT